MVKVFRCQSFASKQVIPITKEPMTIYAAGELVFVATTDCEILVFHVKDGKSFLKRKLTTISQVERVIFNPFKSYIATVEQKKSWKKMTHSVRVYLNWEEDDKNSTPRTKVRVAGKSQMQNISSASSQNLMEIIEIPIDKHATGIAVCSHTGNFAVACGPEVKLCSLVDKTIPTTNHTYLDVEIFLELCWNFPVYSIALSEEFMVCCSKTQVQGIRIRYHESKEQTARVARRSLASSVDLGSRKSSGTSLDGACRASPYCASPIGPADNEDFALSYDNTSYNNVYSGIHARQNNARISVTPDSYKGFFSSVGRRIVTPPVLPKSGGCGGGHAFTTNKVTEAVDDENLVEWDFSESGSFSNISCLPSLQSADHACQCRHHFKGVQSPVLSDFSGSKVKSSSGVEAETILYLCDNTEKEEWISIQLIPSYPVGPQSQPLQCALGTDRMTSLGHSSRHSVSCLISGTQSGYLYQLAPSLNKVSTYQYTNPAHQVSCGNQHLHVLTQSGMETYTSRWAAVALESKHKGMNASDRLEHHEDIHPPSSLDTCLCGHEPFLGVIEMCAGKAFVSLLSKMEYGSNGGGSDETVWSFYIVHCQDVLDQCNDMLQFAKSILLTGPSSYLHLLQEAHLLLSAHKIQTVETNEELEQCLTKVKKLLGDVYAQPDEEDWMLCHAYYNSVGISIDRIVKQAVERAKKTNPVSYGKGLLDFLDKKLYSDTTKASSFPTSPSATEDILEIYATACPEKLSKLVLLSNLTSYKADSVLEHLKRWFSVKNKKGEAITTIDRLALVQIHLTQCEVELACSKLDSIDKPSLTRICCEHPRLLHTDLKSFTPLGQLMRWHRPVCILEILVEMLDCGLFSLDSLLVLLKSQDQGDIYQNSHLKQVLELILNDDKRNDIFEEAVNFLCEIFILLLKDKKKSSFQSLQRQPMKFSLPQGNGFFAPRYGWLDELPPFFGSENMLRPCKRLEVKVIPGQGSRTGSKSLPTAIQENIECSCCLCHENLLKLQSLLCSPNLTLSLSHRVLDLLREPEQEVGGHSSYVFESLDCYWDSIQLLCLTKIDWKLATREIVERYPHVVAGFSSLAFRGDASKYSFLLECMDSKLKTFISQPADDEQAYVKAYKDLLNSMAETFPPSKFVQLLPKDGNLYFLLPFLTRNLEKERSNSLKCSIMDMGKELLSQVT